MNIWSTESNAAVNTVRIRFLGYFGHQFHKKYLKSNVLYHLYIYVGQRHSAPDIKSRLKAQRIMSVKRLIEGNINNSPWKHNTIVSS